MLRGCVNMKVECCSERNFEWSVANVRKESVAVAANKQPGERKSQEFFKSMPSSSCYCRRQVLLLFFLIFPVDHVTGNIIIISTY